MHNWNLVVPLAGLGLLRPVVTLLGVDDTIDGPWVLIVVTALVAVVWIVVAVRQDVKRPVAALATAGALSGLFGLFAIVLQRGRHRGPRHRTDLATWDRPGAHRGPQRDVGSVPRSHRRPHLPCAQRHAEQITRFGSTFA